MLPVGGYARGRCRAARRETDDSRSVPVSSSGRMAGRRSASHCGMARGGCSRWRSLLAPLGAAARMLGDCVRRQGRHAPRRAGRQALQRGPFSSQREEGLQGSRQEVRGSRPPASVFGLGAQVAASCRPTPITRAREYDDSITAAQALRHPASGQRGRCLCAIPDRLVLFRPDPRRDAATRAAPSRPCRRSTRWCANIPTPNMRRAPRRSSKSRATSLPARKWRSAATT